MMDFEQWEALENKLQQYQRIVKHAFQAVLFKSSSITEDKNLLNHQFLNIWQGQIESDQAIHLFSSLGFKEAQQSYQRLLTFRHSPKYRRLSQVARIRLQRFIVLMLHELLSLDEKDKVLLNVLCLLENIVGRSAYLALLIENPLTLKELLYWFSTSSFIAHLIVQYPFLLETLVDTTEISKLPSKKTLIQQLSVKLARLKMKMSKMKFCVNLSLVIGFSLQGRSFMGCILPHELVVS